MTEEKTIDINPHVFNFEKISLVVLATGRYQVEQYRLLLREIRVGYDLQNEYIKCFPQSLGEALYENTHIYMGTRVTFIKSKEETYYMKPNELLFLSEFDHIYVRGIKCVAKELTTKEIDEALAEGKKDADAFLANQPALPGFYK